MISAQDLQDLFDEQLTKIEGTKLREGVVNETSTIQQSNASALKSSSCVSNARPSDLSLSQPAILDA